jgi:hypothetical protein
LTPLPYSSNDYDDDNNGKIYDDADKLLGLILFVCPHKCMPVAPQIFIIQLIEMQELLPFPFYILHHDEIF